MTWTTLVVLMSLASPMIEVSKGDSITIARLQYEGGGDWYANPSSLPIITLRSILMNGGFLHADDNYGLDESFREELAEIFPDTELTEIPVDHPVFHIFFDFPEGLPKIHEHDGEPPQALGIFHGGRLVVFYSYESDLGDGWEDEDVHDDPPEIRERALRMGVNLFMFVLGQAT